MDIAIWIEDRGCNGESTWECSNCGLPWEFPDNSTPFANEMHYCPRCGSKMTDQKFLEIIYC